MSEQFTVEEVNLMCIFDTSGKDTLVAELTAARHEFNEPELNEIAENVLRKLVKMTDDEFAALEIYPVYDNYEESEVQPNGD
jgi:hypothetical protein